MSRKSSRKSKDGIIGERKIAYIECDKNKIYVFSCETYFSGYRWGNKDWCDFGQVYDKIVVSIFERCLKDHVNDLGIQVKLYCQGLSKEQFASQLEEIVYPVYHAAQNMGFDSWELK